MNIKLNKDKCQLHVPEISFLGHVVGKDGLKPDPAKVDAILKMGKPTDKEAMQCLRGTVNFLSRFVPKLTEVIQPITQLTH